VQIASLCCGLCSYTVIIVREPHNPNILTSQFYVIVLKRHSHFNLCEAIISEINVIKFVIYVDLNVINERDSLNHSIYI
jgi:hypothetical protein